MAVWARAQRPGRSEGEKELDVLREPQAPQV